MIDEEYLDIRTITMGISLLDCIDPDIKKSCEKVENKICTLAKDLVKVGNEIEKTSEAIYLEVVGDTKIVMIENNAYDLVLDSNGIGDMDLAITEYAGRGRILHTTEFYDISLGDNLHYSYSFSRL